VKTGLDVRSWVGTLESMELDFQPGARQERLEAYTSRVSAAMSRLRYRGPVVPFGSTALQLLGVELPSRLEDFDRAQFYGDLVYDAELLIIEYDGAVHVQDRRQLERDVRRRRIIQERGFMHMSFTSQDIHQNPQGIITSVGTMLSFRRGGILTGTSVR
jgi:hypothetical protein